MPSDLPNLRPDEPLTDWQDVGSTTPAATIDNVPATPEEQQAFQGALQAAIPPSNDETTHLTQQARDFEEVAEDGPWGAVKHAALPPASHPVPTPPIVTRVSTGRRVARTEDDQADTGDGWGDFVALHAAPTEPSPEELVNAVLVQRGGLISPMTITDSPNSQPVLTRANAIIDPELVDPAEGLDAATNNSDRLIDRRSGT